VAQLTVAVLGLGEAGRAIAADLFAVGVTVQGWDPAPRGDLRALPLMPSQADALKGADVILSVNGATVACAVAEEAMPRLGKGQVYADLNTSAPALKLTLAGIVEPSGAQFADVALMAPVPGHGLQTPALVSGSGAQQFVAHFAPLGMPLEIVDGRPGSAAARKLLRSVFMKGLAAAILEALAAADAAGGSDWLRDNIADELTHADAALVERLVSGSRTHALRRIEEMRAASAYLRELGVPARVSDAATGWLQDLAPR
jgi:3-hydroxyisobutyrate dehydrogenase-like beta-hydroxyacid dehydrogenase